mmetsp:Transcript_26336/g.88528  ORF Transcript_26336/g.88528 Transcript_26336/m.88528 type:complete len:293 (+) Transcript_26336:267-1145(+)
MPSRRNHVETTAEPLARPDGFKFFTSTRPPRSTAAENGVLAPERFSNSRETPSRAKTCLWRPVTVSATNVMSESSCMTTSPFFEKREARKRLCSEPGTPRARRYFSRPPLTSVSGFPFLSFVAVRQTPDKFSESAPLPSSVCGCASAIAFAECRASSARRPICEIKKRYSVTERMAGKNSSSSMPDWHARCTMEKTPCAGSCWIWQKSSSMVSTIVWYFSKTIVHSSRCSAAASAPEKSPWCFSKNASSSRRNLSQTTWWQNALRTGDREESSPSPSSLVLPPPPADRAFEE